MELTAAKLDKSGTRDLEVMKKVTTVGYGKILQKALEAGWEAAFAASPDWRAYAQALLVDRVALEGYQSENDALMATETLKRAYRTDVEPILAEARRRTGGAIDPVATYRASGYRGRVAADGFQQGGA